MGLSIENTVVIQLQLAFFLEGLDLSDKLKLAQEIRSLSPAHFDGEPTILPLPAPAAEVQVPPEIPRVILQAKNGEYVCNIAANRIDVFLKPSGKTPIPAKDTWPDFETLITKFSDYIAASGSIKIRRLGLVANFFMPLSKSANETIRSQFLKKDLFAGLHEIQLNVLHKKRIGAFDINRWIKLGALRQKDDPANDSALSIIVDINTLPEKLAVFSPEECESFIQLCYDDLRKELPTFPIVEG